MTENSFLIACIICGIIVGVVVVVMLLKPCTRVENFSHLTRNKLIGKGCPRKYIDELVRINEKYVIGLHISHADVSGAPRGSELVRPELRGKYGTFTLATISSGDRPFAMYTLKSIESYCAKKGHTFIKRTEPFPIPNQHDHIRNATWQKAFWLRHLLDTIDTEYLMWVDDDILVINDDIDLESFIDRDPGKDVYISYDRWLDKLLFGKKPILNTGAVLVRNSDSARRVLDGILETYYTYDGWVWTHDEQTAFEYVYFTMFRERFSVIPYNSLQVFHSRIKERDIEKNKENIFLYHLAGIPHEKRLPMCRRICERGYVSGVQL